MLAAITTFVLFGHGREDRFCSIQRLLVNANPVVTFHYNAEGNPISMLTNYGPFANNIIYYFRYDLYQRLIAFDRRELRATGDSITVSRHRYSYPDESIIIDTLYWFNSPIPNLIYTYNLDARGRVVKSTYPLEDPFPPVITDYVYDGNGNLERPGVTYDNKMNLFCTNRIWQFIFRDYSENNPSSFGLISSYNSFNLPTHMGSASGYLFENSYRNLVISYSCDPGQAE